MSNIFDKKNYDVLSEHMVILTPKLFNKVHRFYQIGFREVCNTRRTMTC